MRVDREGSVEAGRSECVVQQGVHGEGIRLLRLIGHLRRRLIDIDDATVRKAVIYGSVMASFNVEDFSLNRLKELSPSAIQQRYREFKQLTHFDIDEDF